MSEPRQIAVVRSYDELLAAMRGRAVELNATREALDDIAGLQKGYTAKLLAPGALHGLSRMSMGPMLGALGLELVVREDQAAVKRVKNRLGGGVSWRMLNGVKNEPVILKFSRKYMRNLGIKSGRTRTQKIPKRTRSRIARQAAKARWNPPQVAEMTPEDRARYLKYQEQKARRKRAKTKRRRSTLGVRC